MTPFRIGQGYDVHRLVEGRPLILGGVTIPHDKGLLGHSDADVGMHALTDAIYGALAQGDIGRHFPPSDPQWKGAASEIFLRHAADLARLAVEAWQRGEAIAPERVEPAYLRNNVALTLEEQKALRASR